MLGIRDILVRIPIGSSKSWIRTRIGIQPKMLDPDPYQMNTDPKHGYLVLPELVCGFYLGKESKVPLYGGLLAQNNALLDPVRLDQVLPEHGVQEGRYLVLLPVQVEQGPALWWRPGSEQCSA